MALDLGKSVAVVGGGVRSSASCTIADGGCEAGLTELILDSRRAAAI
jgi:hypothetical protein